MNVCRVCMGSIQEGIKISIFSNVSGEQISKMITICSGIKVQRKDQLTKHVCSTCFNRLENFVALRNDCLNTQLALEKLVHSQTVQEAPNTEMTFILEIEYCNEFHVNEEQENLKFESVDPDENDEVVAESVGEDHVQNNDHVIDCADETNIPLWPAPDMSKKRKRSPPAPVKEELIKEIISLSTGIKLQDTDLGCKQPEYKYKHYSQAGIKCCGCEAVLKTEDDLIPHSRTVHEPNKKNFNKRKNQQCSFCFQLLSINDPTLEDHIITSYECDMCSLVYHNVLSYDEHLQKYHQDLVFKCCGCTFECDTKEQLETHSEEVHLECRKKFLGTSKDCDICYKRIPHNYKMHVHKSQPYRKEVEGKDALKAKTKEYLRCCGPKCFPIFDNKEQLVDHSKEIHLPNRISDADAGRNVFECKMCYSRFLNRNNLTHHQNDTVKTLIQCRFCPLYKPSVAEVRQHEDLHKTVGFKCCGSKCESSFSTYDELLEHAKNIHALNKKIYWFAKEERSFECEVCYKSYKSKHDLNRHKRSIYRDCRFFCDKCFFKTTCQASLDAHNELKHGEVGSYPCKYCKKVFKKELLRTIHHKTHEMTESSFICEICNTGFRRRELLVSHAKTHSSERNFKCDLCTLTYKRSSHLSMHVRRVHNKERKVACRYCDKLFYSSSNRKKHERTHSASLKTNICQYCGKAYTMRCDYVVHVETHVPDLEKKFPCNKCPKKFSEEGFLETHFRFNHMKVAATASPLMKQCSQQREWEPSLDINVDDQEIEDYLYDEIGDPVAAYTIVDGEVDQEIVVT